MYPTTIGALILLLRIFLVGHRQLVVFLDILVATLTHLLLRQSWLFAETLVNLCLQNTELVQFGLLRHTQFTIALRTLVQTRPEVRILINNLGIVTYSRTRVTCLFQQQCAIIKGHEVIRLQLQHEVEVGDGTVVIAHLGTQQASVIMAEEVVGIEIECRIIVSHCTTQITLVKAGHSTIDIQTRLLRQ